MLSNLGILMSPSSTGIPLGPRFLWPSTCTTKEELVGLTSRVFHEGVHHSSASPIQDGHGHVTQKKELMRTECDSLLSIRPGSHIFQWWQFSLYLKTWSFPVPPSFLFFFSRLLFVIHILPRIYYKPYPLIFFYLLLIILLSCGV